MIKPHNVYRLQNNLAPPKHSGKDITASKKTFNGPKKSDRKKFFALMKHQKAKEESIHNATMKHELSANSTSSTDLSEKTEGIMEKYVLSALQSTIKEKHITWDQCYSDKSLCFMPTQAQQQHINFQLKFNSTWLKGSILLIVANQVLLTTTFLASTDKQYQRIKEIKPGLLASLNRQSMRSLNAVTVLMQGEDDE